MCGARAARLAAAALLWCLVVTVSGAGAAQLVVVHYELLVESEPSLLAALAQAVRSVRAIEQHVIVLNPAGANLTGVPADAHAVGAQSVAALGDVPLLTHADGHTVAANLRLPAPMEDAVPASVVLQLGTAARVGVIGVVPESLQGAARSGAVVTDPVKAVGEEAERLREEGVGTVLALGRLDEEEALRLAREVPSLDALVVPGGRRERPVYPEPVTRSAGGAVPLLEAPLVTAPGYIGLVTLTLADDGRVSGWHGRVMPLRASAPAPAVAALLSADASTDFGQGHEQTAHNWAGFCPLTAGEVGTTLAVLDGHRDTCSRRECSLGSTLADALLLAATAPSATSWSQVTLALISAGSLSGSLPRCAVTEVDLAAAVATEATAMTLSLPGFFLRQVFEVSASGVGSAAFLQTAGVRVVFDLSRPVGSRVHQLQVLCAECHTPRYEDVRSSSTYRLVTDSRLAAGADGYHLLAARASLAQDWHRPVRDVLRQYVRTRSPLAPPTGGRVLFTSWAGLVSEPPPPQPLLNAALHHDVHAPVAFSGTSSRKKTTVAPSTPAPLPAEPVSVSKPAETITEALQSTSVSDMVFNSAMWSLGGFVMLGMMIMAFF